MTTHAIVVDLLIPYAQNVGTELYAGLLPGQALFRKYEISCYSSDHLHVLRQPDLPWAHCHPALHTRTQQA